MTSIHSLSRLSEATGFGPADPVIFSAGENKYAPLFQVAAVLFLSAVSWAILIALGIVFGTAVPVAIYLTSAVWLAYEIKRAPLFGSDAFLLS